MSWALGIGVYFVVWWVTLAAVLPWGVRSQHEAPADRIPGTDPGAPTIPHMGRRILANTLLAAVVWVIIDVVYIVFYLRAWP